jgi:hypothetical protein
MTLKNKINNDQHHTTTGPTKTIQKTVAITSPPGAASTLQCSLSTPVQFASGK